MKQETKKRFGQKTAAEIYLEYVNEWLTITAMADNYGRPKGELEELILKGKEEHEKSLTPSPSKEKIFELVAEVYQEKGQLSAMDEAYKYDIVKEEYCNPCETESPSIDHTCLICGSSTTPLPSIHEEGKLKNEIAELLKTIYHEIDIHCFSETENVSMTTIREVLVKHGANEPDLW